MKFEMPTEELRPLVQEVVAETLRQLGLHQPDRAPLNPPPPNGLLDVRAVAKRLGIGTTKLRELTKRGEIPKANLPGRLVRYRPEDIDAYLDRGSDTNTTS